MANSHKNVVPIATKTKMPVTAKAAAGVAQPATSHRLNIAQDRDYFKLNMNMPLFEARTDSEPKSSTATLTPPGTSDSLYAFNPFAK